MNHEINKMTETNKMLLEFLKTPEKITEDEWEKIYIYILSLEKQIAENEEVIKKYAESYKKEH